MIYIVGLLFTAGAIVAGYYAAKRISDPVTATAGVLNNTAEGDFTNIIDDMHEQSTAVEQIHSAINQINEVTQQNAALGQELTASSDSMNSEGEILPKWYQDLKFNLQRMHRPSFAADLSYEDYLLYS